jgi:glucosylceramidase
MMIIKKLRKKLDEHGLDTKIWMLDHNFSMWNRVRWMLDDAAFKQAVSGAAFHYYDGTPDMLSRLHRLHPDIPFHWTEGGPNLGDSYDKDWCVWAKVFIDAVNNWCSSITGWNLLLDEYGRPNTGPFSCAGLATYIESEGSIRYSGQYKAMWHFSHFVSRGARQIKTTGIENATYSLFKRLDDHYHCAFVNPDKSIIVIVDNPRQKQPVQLHLCGKTYRIELPENSISTVVFK